MRIAIVSDEGLAGGDTGQLAAALAAQGHDVTAYVPQPGRRRPRSSASQDYRIVPLCVGPDAARSDREALPLLGDWAATLERSWSSSGQPDILHAFGWLSGLAAQLAARHRRLPTVQTFQGLALSCAPAVGCPDNDAERRSIEPLLARNATWVTGESNADLDALAKLRHSRAHLSVLTGGVDIERYSPVGPALAHTDLHRVLCLAPNPLPCSGFDIVIRALPWVPGIELVIAETAATDDTHDEARAGLKHLATELGVADRVLFMGTVGGDKLPKLLRSADVLACTPRQPPRPTAVLQAMASGVAVVALQVGVLSDIVVHGVTGLVLSPSDPNELITALKSLTAQRFQCQSMGAAGRNRATLRYTWDRTAFESLSIYRELTSPYLRSGGSAPQPAGVRSSGGRTGVTAV